MYQVLIADDEPWAVYRLQKLIDWEKNGFALPQTAADGLSALEIIRKEQPELLLSDIRMPGLDGLKLVREVNQVSPYTTVILITGFSEFSYAQEALRQGVFDYLVKPVKKEDLLAVLSRAAARLEENSSRSAAQAASAYPSTQTGRIMKMIDENFTQDLRLSDLADQLYLTAQYLSVLIKKETGLTFSELVIRKRIGLAKKLLLETERPIQDIMEQVGYRDYSCFIRLFKKHEGCTPYTYRKNAARQAAPDPDRI
ncbi:MAG TPA: response regulator [Candidatus Eisenbergiella merdavium]|uniref:Stage 0 sporulation protein A homolog n=1 Tax=Candidatus Eisenbergiella merdavium TaxID=2838551 RepID=A0A9D2SS97_9FIRM|nr:response regulator [Candidatus Eisenbergiella merdavium]